MTDTFNVDYSIELHPKFPQQVPIRKSVDDVAIRMAESEVFTFVAPTELVYDHSKYNRGTINILSSGSIGALDIDAADMQEGDIVHLAVDAPLILTLKEGVTMCPPSFTANGLVDLKMIGGLVYATSGADSELDSLKAMIGAYTPVEEGGTIASELAVAYAGITKQGMVQKLEAVEQRKDETIEILNNKIINNPIINDTGAVRAYYDIGLAGTTGSLRISVIAPGTAGNAYQILIGKHSSPGTEVETTWDASMTVEPSLV